MYNITVSNNSGSGIRILWESNLIMDSLIVNYNNPGGGIYCFGSSNVTLKNSSIIGNTLFSLYEASGGGLGIRKNCNVNLQNVSIAYNSVYAICAPFAAGGGIYCYSSTLELSGVTVKYNEANHAGGGICSSWNSEIIFDSDNKSSIYYNFAPVGHDIYLSDPNLIQEIILDTFSVTHPTDYYAEPGNYLDFSIDHGLVQQIDADLYVSPNGSNSNSGLTEEDPYKVSNMHCQFLGQTASILIRFIYCRELILPLLHKIIFQ